MLLAATASHRSRSLAVAVTLALATLAACGDQQDGGESAPPEADAPTSLEDVTSTEDFAAYLGSLPGVEEVEADRQEADTDLYLLNIDVGVSDDVTSDQMVGVFDAVIEHGYGSLYNETPDFSLHAASNPDHRLSLWLYEDTDVEPLVETFLSAAASTTLDDLGWYVGSQAQVEVDDEGQDLASVTALAEAVATDPDLAEVDGWVISSGEDVVPAAYLSTRIGFTDEVLAAWAHITSTPDDPVALAAATLVPGDSFGSYVADAPPPDAFSVSVALDFGVAPAEVTAEQYGDVVTSLIETHGAALELLPSDEDEYALNQRDGYDDVLLAEVPLSDDPEYWPGDDVDPAWQEAAERAAG